MANYSLVIGSKFTPFTFDELLKPALMATQAHQELEGQYSELGINSSRWEDLINEQIDAELHGKVSQYSKDLEAQASLLASQGLSPTSRKDLLAMKNRYSKDIDPIQAAYVKREELSKEQRNALLKDPSLIFDVDYSTASLKSLIDNPSASFNPISGDAIAKRTATMAKEAASAIMSDPEYSSVFEGQYIQQKINQGYTLEQVVAAAQRDPNAPKALLDIIDSVKKEVGYDNWSEGSQQKIDSYINEGLNAAVIAPKVDVMNNKAYMTSLERERAKLQDDILKLQKAQIDANTNGIPTPDGGRIIKLGGNNWIQYDKDGKVVNQHITNTPEEKAALELESDLVKQNSLKGIKKLGFTPIRVVAKTGGSWHYGQEGDDAPDVLFGSTRSQVVTNWGNYTYNPDNSEEITYVSDISTIPGFSEEFMMGTGTMPDKNTAFGQIVEAARDAGITDEEFRSDRVIIAKVKAENNRAEPYDYVIFRKN